MKLEILTPDKTIYSGDVISVTVPGSMGSFQVLNQHAPIISTLEAGNVVVRTAAKGVEAFLILGGVVEALNNKVVILVEGLSD